MACLRYSVALRCVTLRYVDEVMDLLSMLTKMLDGQSLEISPNKWHSLCTPPVCRSTRPNDLTNNNNRIIKHNTEQQTLGGYLTPHSSHPLSPFPSPPPLPPSCKLGILLFRLRYSTSSLSSHGYQSSSITHHSLATIPPPPV